MSRFELRESRSGRETVLFAIPLVIGMVFYHALYFNNIFPISIAWGEYYAELVNHGAIPYLDFSYYLPPFSLLVDWLFWNLSFGHVIIYRALYLFERIAMIVLLYSILCRYFKPRFVWISCLVGCCLGTACVYDLCGDYNTHETFLVITICFFACRFFESGVDKGALKLAQYRDLVACGFIIGLLLLTKQSAGLATVLVYLIFLTVYCIFFRDRRFLKYCLAVAGGVVVPWIIAVFALSFMGALPAFFGQFFGAAGAKGGAGVILTGWLTCYFLDVKFLSLFVALTVTFCESMRIASGKRSVIHLSLLIISTSVLLLLIVLFYGKSIARFSSMLSVSDTILLGSVLLIIVSTLCFCMPEKNKFVKALTDNNYLWFTCLLLVVTFLAVITNWHMFSSNIYGKTNLFDDVVTLMNYACVYANIMLLIAGLLFFAKTNKLLYPKPLFILLSGSIAASYMTLMGSGGVLPPSRQMFVTVPVILSWLFSVSPINGVKFKNGVVCIICVIIITLCSAQKYVAAYSWWGASSAPLSERTEQIDLEYFDGATVSQEMKLQFEEVTKIIEENYLEGDTVWGFPFVKVFNVITEYYDLSDPVPVLFYDICSDEEARRELTWLEENPPEIIVWCDIPGCMKVHEDMFRNGDPLGQRAIQAWFEDSLPQYRLVGQVGNLFVYIVDDGRQIDYTFFEDEGAINRTLGESSVIKLRERLFGDSGSLSGLEKAVYSMIGKRFAD